MKKITTQFTRGSLVESTHSIKAYICNSDGKVLIKSCNENNYIYPRSAIKIFQAIPFVESDAINFFKLNTKSVALACSSHRGEVYHIKELRNWINKIGIKKKDLKCGIHYPLNKSSSEKLLKSNSNANELHNNCAGKHLAMISSCLIKNYGKEKYLDFNHPHQIKIREVFEKFTGRKLSKKNYGLDGCSAPQYSFKIKDINKMLINLIKSYNSNFAFSKETKILIDSIIKYPNYIGGTDSLDSILMKISNKKIFCKGGAEGVFLFIDLKKKIAGVLKVADGNERALPSVVYNLFKKLKIMSSIELKKFSKYYNFQLFNHAKIKVGSIEINI